MIEHPAHGLVHPDAPAAFTGAWIFTSSQASRWRRRWLLVAALPALPSSPSGGAAVVGIRASHPLRSIKNELPWNFWWLICCIARELALREVVAAANRGWSSLTVASAHEAENERDKESRRCHWFDKIKRNLGFAVGVAESLIFISPRRLDDLGAFGNRCGRILGCGGNYYRASSVEWCGL